MAGPDFVLKCTHVNHATQSAAYMWNLDKFKDQSMQMRFGQILDCPQRFLPSPGTIGSKKVDPFLFVSNLGRSYLLETFKLFHKLGQLRDLIDTVYGLDQFIYGIFRHGTALLLVFILPAVAKFDLQLLEKQFESVC
jgi:hypothetical protein